jgi:hypothetical protein
MQKQKKSALALALLVALCVNGVALAAPRDDRGSAPKSWLKNWIVKILEDIKGGLPPG